MTKEKVGSSHHLKINQETSNKARKHEVDLIQQQQKKNVQMDHFNVGDVEKTTCLKTIHIEK